MCLGNLGNLKTVVGELGRWSVDGIDNVVTWTSKNAPAKQ